jgi:flagellar biosynthetic protein FlhB
LDLSVSGSSGPGVAYLDGAAVAENSSGGEKTEQPTPKRLSDARDDGQVCFSSEIVVAGLLLVGFCAMALSGPWFWQAMAATMRNALGDALTWHLDDRQVQHLLLWQYANAFKWLLPFLAVMFLAGLVLCISQVGFHLTLKPLIPKPERLSPITGFSRLFGRRGLMRFVLSFLKLSLVMWIAYSVLCQDIPRITYIKADIAERTARVAWMIFSLVMKLVSVLLLIAATDYVFQRFQYIRDMMMTKQEVRDEMKQSEGNPMVKGRIRRLQREMAKRRMMQEVPKADVVITNPTHVAVALKYDRQNMFAPVVIAKGYDEVAQRIKALAQEHGIVQVENIPLARALAKEVEIGKPIPTKWYIAVAEVLTMVYKLKKKAG